MKLKEYVIYEDRPAYPYCKTLGTRRFDAFPTHGKSWEELREFLPPTVVHYATIKAASKPDAVKQAKARWGKDKAQKPEMTKSRYG
jgi:hypothetical protein